MEFAQKTRKASTGSCCVTSCNSRKKNGQTVVFHRVPGVGSATVEYKNHFGQTVVEDKRSVWLQRLKIENRKTEMLVCSLHFSADDYFFPNIDCKKKDLKKNAIPESVTVPVEKIRKNFQRRTRYNNRSINKEQKNIFGSHGLKNLIHNVPNKKSESDRAVNQSTFDRNLFLQKISEGVSVASMLENMTEPNEHDEYCQDQQDSYSEEALNESNANETLEAVAPEGPESVKQNEPGESGLCKTLEAVPCDDTGNLEQNEEVDSALCSQFSQKVCIDKGTQVKSGDLSVTFSCFIETSKDLMTMCNIRSFAVLDQLVEAMDKCYPRKRKQLLSTRDSIIVTTAKLKLDISFSALSIFFKQVSHATIRNVFYDTVKILANILQSTLLRISKEEILQNMPKCFKKYQDTTSVLDCTEIKIQQPKCLKCCIKFYSHYKGGLTVKFMTEVTPGGIIVGLSEAFGGRASDKTIFNQTNTLQHLESTRDAVMVDKGFLIDDECAEKRIKLIRPPFLKQQAQLSEHDSIENKDIACARVHIERMNQRIKSFQLLNNKVPWYFVNYIDDIFIICCGLSNLGTPILADDKFE